MTTHSTHAQAWLPGLYPERRVSGPPSRMQRWLAALSLPRLGRPAAGDFVARVRAAQQALRDDPAPWQPGSLAGLRAQLAREGPCGPALPQAMAVVLQACQRTLGVEPFDTQLIAARVMLEGELAEMATGEGKTLAAAITAAVAALAGIPVHVMTTNDYLVERDARSLTPLYAALGLSCGTVTQPMDSDARRAAYACDITYCTAKELVFDYLRDGLLAPRGSTLEQRAAALSTNGSNGVNGVNGGPRRLLRGLPMAIVDEADSILIDEARVPLILSQAVPGAAMEGVHATHALAQALTPSVHYTVRGSPRVARLTVQGRAHLDACAGTGPWLNRAHRDEGVVQALTALHVLRLGHDYVVEAGRVHIVDAATGRKAMGRAWSHGLQQHAELKEGCALSPQLRTVAQITYQRFFPRYLKLCGMSGTLTEARGELRRIYGLRVTRVAVRLPDQRTHLPARVVPRTVQLWPAVAARVRELHAAGRPVLIGTDNVLDSEALSQCLSAGALAHTVLNASQDQHEAQVIAAAGTAGAITVATNMAGRGTDIVLTAASRAAGGLHVICCQQNAARRIDRQLVGRCARQGDPGSYEYFVALDGPLLRSGGMAKKLFKNNYLNNSRWVEAALRRAQREAECRQAREREALMRRDERISEWLAFGGSES